MGTFWRHFGPFGGPFWHIWGVRGDLFGTFGRSGAHFETGTFKKGGGDCGGVAFGSEKWPQGLPKTPGKATNLRPNFVEHRMLPQKEVVNERETAALVHLPDFLLVWPVASA